MLVSCKLTFVAFGHATAPPEGREDRICPGQTGEDLVGRVPFLPLRFSLFFFIHARIWVVPFLVPIGNKQRLREDLDLGMQPSEWLTCTAASSDVCGPLGSRPMTVGDMESKLLASDVCNNTLQPPIARLPIGSPNVHVGP